jgi:hypothetical protein
MKVLNSNRVLIYQILDACFKACKVKPTIAEVGVLKGENAEVIDKIFSPESLYLIDAWSPEGFSDYNKNNAHRHWVADINEYAYYFGGSLSDQSTFDNLYQGVIERFETKDHVKIMRCSSFDAHRYLSDNITSAFHLIYIDASHQYETVLDDLMFYKDFLSHDGVLQLNDCCHSELGIKQNLGVLEAVVKFTKMTDYVPVAITNTDWSDVILVRKDSQLIPLIDQIINQSDISYVEIPPQLLGALKVRNGVKQNLSFI